jgi:hypothetical protein
LAKRGQVSEAKRGQVSEEVVKEKCVAVEECEQSAQLLQAELLVYRY